MAAVGLVAAAGVAMAQPNTAGASTQRSAPSYPPVHLSARLASLPDAIGKAGSGRYSDIYGGLVGVNGGEQVDVYLTRLDPAAEAEFRALAPAGIVTFLKTPHSLKKLNVLHQQVLNGTASLAAHRVRVNQFWPETRTGREDIGVENLTSRGKALVERKFGRNNVHVFDVPPSARAVPTDNRIGDRYPYRAGDTINNGGGCTSRYGLVHKPTGGATCSQPPIAFRLVPPSTTGSPVVLEVRPTWVR